VDLLKRTDRRRLLDRAPSALRCLVPLDERLQVLLGDTLDRIDRTRLESRPEHQGRHTSKYDHRQYGKSYQPAAAG